MLPIVDKWKISNFNDARTNERERKLNEKDLEINGLSFQSNIPPWPQMVITTQRGRTVQSWMTCLK